MESTFDLFWLAYPRRVGKLAAMKAYAKAIKEIPSTVIIDAAQKYALERLGQPDCYTKHPSTWLNAGCWDDYVYKPQDKPVVQNGFYADFCSPELEAWEAYGLAGGKKYPRDRRGGWTFPTRWPPNHTGNTEAGRELPYKG